MTGAHTICLWSTVGLPDPLLLERVLRVFRYCNSLTKWDGMILFSVLDPKHYFKVDGLRVIQLPEVDRVRWQIMIGRVVPAVLEHYKFNIGIHDDGFPMDVSLWNDEFLNYDYVGAPWNYTGTVGSGGCAMTSHRFMHACTQLPWFDGKTNLDEWLCKVNRPELLRQGLRFAPPEVAIRFCTETTDQRAPSFAYHGKNHAVEKHRMAWDKLKAWERQAGWL